MGTYTAIVTDSNNLTDTINVSVSGQLEDCDYNADCPTIIDFDEYIPDVNNHTMPTGTYTAERSIQTSASILQGNEVDLKAGDIITLKPGFSMQGNTRLSIRNENCGEE